MFWQALKWVLRTLAFLALGGAGVSLLAEAVLFLLRRVRNVLILRKLVGKWAVITGCTDGIGLGMAKELAERGINMVLISRNMDKLQALQKELGEKVKTELVQIDFEEEIDFRKLLEPIRHHKPHLLVNNVGVNASKPTAFTEHTKESIDRIVQVNIANTLRITQEYLSWDVLPSETKYVLGTGSMLGSIPSPFQQVYAGTKAFLQVWLESLAAEAPGYHFEVFMTGLVCTKLSGVKRPSVLSPSSAVYGKKCIHSFGLTAVTYPHFPHYVLGVAASLFPRGLVGLVLNHAGKIMRERRKRPLQKSE